MTSSAHCSSLPLFSAIQKVRGRPIWEATKNLAEMLEQMKLERDIEPVVVLDRDLTIMDLQPISRFGTAVLEELKSRAEFLPCPEGECEYDATDTCRWCGKLK